MCFSFYSIASGTINRVLFTGIITICYSGYVTGVVMA